MNSINKSFAKIELLGRLLTKSKRYRSIQNLSEEVMISIHNLSSSKFFYQYKLYLINKDRNKNSLWDNLSFDINENMKFSLFFHGIEYLEWSSKTNVYFFGILLDEYNENNKNIFIKILNQCLNSIINKISFQDAAKEIEINPVNYIKNIGEIQDLESHANKTLASLENIYDKEIEEKQIAKDTILSKIAPMKLDNIINLEVAKKIFCSKGELYNYNISKGELINLNVSKKTLLTIYHLDNGKFEYILCSETLNKCLISIDKINNGINGQIISNKTKKFFCWKTSKCYTSISWNCIGFIFDEPEDCEIFKKILDKAIYENKYNKAYEHIPKENTNIVKEEFNIQDNNAYSSDEEDEKEEPNENITNNEETKNGYETIDIDEEYKELESSKENVNLFNLDSLSDDRAYCITDNNKIMAYKINQEEDNIEKIGMMPIVQEYNENENNTSIFSQGLLYKSENNILFLDENDPYSLYQYDLTKRKIISEWKTNNVQISDICPYQKNGQTTDNPVIYGVNPKSIFAMDGRVNNKNNIVEIKSYSRKIDSNKIISTNNGEFVTGTSKGELRLYDKIGNRAKNLFSLYGDPINHIDISSDEHFLLITCDKYLLLLNIMNQNGIKSGFNKVIRANDRSTPIRLQIKNSDIIKYELAKYNYTNAKFNLNKKGENNIITSLGEFVIVWNYNDIKKGKIANYKIKKVNDIIIDNTFKVGNENKILITLPTKVRIQNLKNIK